MNRSRRSPSLDQIPTVVTAEAEEILKTLAEHKKVSEARELMSRLVNDPRMKRVWRELYRKSGNGFLHPACVTHADHARRAQQTAANLRQENTKKSQIVADSFDREAAYLEILEGPFFGRWSAQDEGIRFFFFHAFRNGFDINPNFASQSAACAKKLETVSADLRRAAAKLESFGKKGEARKIRFVADDCDDEALLYKPPHDDPGIILRKSNIDPKIRTFVVWQTLAATAVFAKPLYGTVSTIGNVVFPDANLTAIKVREMMRS